MNDSKFSKRLIACDESLWCKICLKKISRASNLRKHLKLKHNDFIENRMYVEGHSSLDESIDKTYWNHVNKNSFIPPDLLISRKKDDSISVTINAVDTDSIKSSRNLAAASVISDLKSSSSNDRDVSNNLINSKESTALNQTNISEECGTSSEVNSTKNPICIETASPTIPVNNNENLPQHMIRAHPPKSIQSCIACPKMEAILSFHQDILQSCCQKLIEGFCDCPCKATCCCLKKKEQWPNNQSEHTDNEYLIDKKRIKDHFFCREQNGIKRWFCKICHEFCIERKKHFEDFHYKGSVFSEVDIRNYCMKKHLASKQHISSEAQSKFLTEKVISKRTENLCIAGQFLASYNLSPDFYLDLYQFLDRTCTYNIVNEDANDIHPFGKDYQNEQSLRQSQMACHKAICDEMTKQDRKRSPYTKQEPRYALSFDNGTVYKDGQRQVIIMTKLNRSGMPEDKLVSTSILKDSSSDAAFKHITKETSSIISTQNIAVICSVNKPVDTLNISDINKKIKKNKNYSDKVILITDVCHIFDKIMFPINIDPKELWVLDTIVKCKSIMNSVLDSNISKFLRAYEIENIHNVKYYEFEKPCNTNFTIHGHFYFSTILKNLEIFCKCLPKIVSEGSQFDSLTKESVRGIIKMISDPILISRIFLLDTVFIYFSKVRNVAQEQQFGPFDYVRVVDNLYASLKVIKSQEVHKIRKIIDHIVDYGVVHYTYSQSETDCEVKIDLKSLNMQVKTNEFEDTDNEKCHIQYIEWIDILLSRLDEMLIIPNIIKFGVEIFSIPTQTLTEEDLVERTQKFRSFFNQINVDFQKCSKPRCSLLCCPCLYMECKSFFSHVIEIKDLYRNEKGFDHMKLFSFFLSDYFHDVKLLIPNLLRALEVMQLIKSSQSATEKVVSQVTEVMKTLKNSNRVNGLDNFDIVNATIFLKMNSNIYNMDPYLSRSILHKNIYGQALQKRKQTASSKTLAGSTNVSEVQGKSKLQNKASQSFTLIKKKNATKKNCLKISDRLEKINILTKSLRRPNTANQEEVTSEQHIDEVSSEQHVGEVSSEQHIGEPTSYVLNLNPLENLHPRNGVDVQSDEPVQENHNLSAINEGIPMSSLSTGVTVFKKSQKEGNYARPSIHSFLEEKNLGSISIKDEFGEDLSETKCKEFPIVEDYVLETLYRDIKEEEEEDIDIEIIGAENVKEEHPPIEEEAMEQESLLEGCQEEDNLVIDCQWEEVGMEQENLVTRFQDNVSEEEKPFKGISGPEEEFGFSNVWVKEEDPVGDFSMVTEEFLAQDGQIGSKISDVKRLKGIHSSDQPSARLKKGRNQPYARLQKGSDQPSARLQKSSDQPSARLQKSSDQPSARLQKGSDQPSARLQKGSDQPSARLKKGCNQTYARLQKGSDQPSARLQKGSDQPSARLQKSSDQSSARIQKSSEQPSARLQKSGDQPTPSQRKISTSPSSKVVVELIAFPSGKQIKCTKCKYECLLGTNKTSKCPKCKQYLSQKGSNQIKAVDSSNVIWLKCSICSFACKRIEDLRKHMSRHGPS